MAIYGADTVVGIKPTTTWNSAGTIAALGGILPLTIDKIDKGATWNWDDSSGLGFKTVGSIEAETADPNIIGRLRWNSAAWSFLANLIGDSTQSGPTGSIYAHTMTYQQDSALAGITLGIEINNTANGIMEISSLKVQSFTFEPDGGYWNFNVATLGTTVLKAGDATFDGTAADNITYQSGSAQRMRYRANQLRINEDAGALDAADVIADARNMSVALSREYDLSDDLLVGAATGAELVRAEPIDTRGGIDGILQFDQVTADIANFTNLFGTDFKGDIQMAETIGSDAHTFKMEMNDLVMIDPQLALDRGQRIPMNHNYEMGQVAATPTGMTNGLPFHIILSNLQSITYETLAAP